MSKRTTVFQPTESPIAIVTRAGAALSGFMDAQLRAHSNDPDLHASILKDPHRSSLARILALRLGEAYGCLALLGLDVHQQQTSLLGWTEKQLHRQTARAALLCLQYVNTEQRRIKSDANRAVGARDHKTIATLIAIVSQWSFEPALLEYDLNFARYKAKLSPKRSQESTSQSARGPQDQRLAPKNVSPPAKHDFDRARTDLTALLLEVGEIIVGDTAPKSGFSIPAELLLVNRSLGAQIFSAAVRLAYGPNTGDTDCARKSSQAILKKMLNTLPSASLFSFLSAWRSSTDGSNGLPPAPGFVRQICSRLLSAQLLREEGVTALLSTVVGLEGERLETLHSPSGATESATVRLDRLALLFIIPPLGFDRRVFILQHTLPALLRIVNARPFSPPGFAKAAVYTFVKMFAGKDRELLREGLSPLLWDPLLRKPVSSMAKPSQLSTSEELMCTLQTLHTLITYSPPTSEWLRWLLNPIITTMWGLLDALETSQSSSKKVAHFGEASLRPLVTDLVKAWFAVASEDEIVHLQRDLLLSPRSKSDELQPCFTIVDGSPELWWNFPARTVSVQQETLMLLGKLQVPEIGEAQEDVDEEASKRLLQALDSQGRSRNPCPELFVALLSQTNRHGVASALLSVLLEWYLATKSSLDPLEEAQRRSLRLLHLIVILLKEFGESIVRFDAERALRFVHFCLRGTAVPVPVARKREDQTSATLQRSEDDDIDLPLIQPHNTSPQGAIESLQNVLSPAEETTAKKPPDISTDSEEGQEADSELCRTAVELLLSVLEQHPEMTAHSTSLLFVIGRLLSEPCMTAHPDSAVRRLVREASLALLARAKSDDGETEDDLTCLNSPISQAKRRFDSMFQEALKLLQDPIVPVRAHGIVMLRDLVASSSPTGTTVNGTTEDKAFQKFVLERLESITEILFDAVRDEESYIYLNAVQGIKEVILCGRVHLGKVLVKYCGCLSPAQRSQIAMETEFRLRLGESLLQAVQRLAEAGAVYADEIMPALCRGLADDVFPTTLRASCLSLLGTCVEAFPLTVASKGYAEQLVESALDILRIEVVTRDRAADALQPSRPREEGGSNRLREQWAPGGDDATGLDTGYPQLRRGALLLLGLLIRGARHQLEDQAQDYDDGVAAREINGFHVTALRLPDGSTLPSLTDHNINRPRSRLPPLLFKQEQIAASRRVAQYVMVADNDALVRHQASDITAELDALEIAHVHCGVADMRIL